MIDPTFLTADPGVPEMIATAYALVSVVLTVSILTSDTGPRHSRDYRMMTPLHRTLFIALIFITAPITAALGVFKRRR